MNRLDQPRLLYPDVIANNAKLFGSKPAVICDGESLSWKDFHRRTNKVANSLIGLGLRKGDKVCLVMQSSIAMFELLWGTIKAGGVTVPLNVMMSKDSLGLLINNSDARFLFVDDSTAHLIDDIRNQLDNVSPEGMYAVNHSGSGWHAAEQLVDTSPDTDPMVTLDDADSMNIIYSSGTTGVPKGIEHSHFARILYPLSFGPSIEIDRFATSICSTPLYTNGTWITMLPTVYSGGTVVLLPKFSAEAFLHTVAQKQCTHAFLVPTQFIVILDSPEFHKYDTSSMRMLLSGGQPMPTKTLDHVREKFPQAHFYECYGMTEGFVTVAGPRDYERGKAGSVGLPIFGGDICIIDEDEKELPRGEMGEIAGWSPALMKGYYNDPKRTDEIIWNGVRGRTYLKSGDVGYMDEEGYLYVSGRTKDMIKSGGINVFASDIEEVFMQHPEVREAAVIGIPHEKWGETPLLFAIMHEGSTISGEELMRWGNERLGKYQRVSGIEFRTEFPRAGHDKVRKMELRDPYWEGHERKI